MRRGSPDRRLSEEPLGFRRLDDGAPAAYAEFVTQMAYMAADCFRGDHEGGCDFLVGAALWLAVAERPSRGWLSTQNLEVSRQALW